MPEVTNNKYNPKAHRFMHVRRHPDFGRAVEALHLDLEDVMANLECTRCGNPEGDHDGSQIPNDVLMREQGAPTLPGFGTP